MKRIWLLACFCLLFIQACGDDKPSTPPVGDTTAPARVQDLAVESAGDDRVTLRWTAPGDDGMEGQASRYDIRYATSPLTDEEWDAATVMESPPEPRPANEAETCVIAGLSSDTWYFGLKAIDEVPRWSGLSNVVDATLADHEAPSPVNDLEVDYATTGSMTLTWTATGDDGSQGQASEYDLRYSLSNITDENWDAATRVDGVLQPAGAGAQKSFAIIGLLPTTEYSFALRVADEASNWSEISNVIDEPTLALWRLTTSPGQTGADHPAWSPDGRSIVFNADWIVRFHDELYMAPVEGGEATRLTNDPVGAVRPSWSPDGNQLTLVSHRSGSGRQELHVMDAAAGAEATLLASHGNGEQWVGHNSWAPDGSRIVYSVLISRDPYLKSIYTIPSGGGPPELLVEGTSADAWPAWSPDVTQIAFSSDRSGGNDIWVTPVDGGGAVQLSFEPAFETHPAWSPDGSRIAYTSEQTGNSDIWVMSSSGGNPTQLTFDPANDVMPAWSPDGSQIAFLSWRSGQPEIWIMSSTGEL